MLSNNSPLIITGDYYASLGSLTAVHALINDRLRVMTHDPLNKYKTNDSVTNALREFALWRHDQYIRTKSGRGPSANAQELAIRLVKWQIRLEGFGMLTFLTTDCMGC